MLQIWLFFVGLGVGLLAGLIRKGNTSAVVGDMVVGALGSFVGGMIFGTLSLAQDFPSGSFIAAVAAALIFVTVAETTKNMRN